MVLCINLVADYNIVAIGKDEEEAVGLALAELTVQGAAKDEISLHVVQMNQGEALDFDKCSKRIKVPPLVR